MARENVMKLRLVMARKTDPSNMDSLLDTAKAVESMKAAAEENGFKLIEDASAKVGTHDFDEPVAPAEPQTEATGDQDTE